MIKCWVCDFEVFYGDLGMYFGCFVFGFFDSVVVLIDVCVVICDIGWLLFVVMFCVDCIFVSV